jgi:hypothetical protein
MPEADERRSYDVEETDSIWAQRLRARYTDVAQELLPEMVRKLLEQLADVESCRR